MIRLLFFLITVSVFSSCSSNTYNQTSERPYLKIARDLKFSYAKQLEKTEGFQLVGEGGAMFFDVKEIDLYFRASNKLTLDDARKLYVKIIQNFLDRINSNQEIRPYLHEYPFTAKGINISIAFNDRNDIPYQKNYVAKMIMIHGNVNYSTFDSSTDSYQIMYEEPYEEAVKIVQSQNQ